MSQTQKIAVVGGGISGIAAAFYCAKKFPNATIDLYESEAALGGRIASTELGTRWIDFGGKNIGRRYDLFRDFLKQLGCDQFQYFGLNTSQKIGNRVITINKDRGRLFNAISVSRKIGVKGLVRLLRAARVIKKNRAQGYLNTDYFNEIAKQLDHQPLSHYFSKKTLEGLIRPLTVRMNGAEPDECYYGNFGSNLNLLLDNYDQLESGMHQWLTVFQSYSENICIKTSQEVQAIRQSEQGYVLQSADSSENYDHIIVALPAKSAARLLAPMLPAVANSLSHINYFPVAVAVVEYEKPVFNQEIRAMVFDPTSVLSNAGAYGIHDLNLVRYTFSGKTARNALPNRTGIELIQEAEHLMAQANFNVVGNQRQRYFYKVIESGLCAYSQHHHERLFRIESNLPPGLVLVGDYWRGASIEACFRTAFEKVNRYVSVHTENHPTATRAPVLA